MVKIFCDGGARGNPGPAAAAFVVEEDGKIIHKNSKFLGKVTNNIAEYNAVILALKWLSENINNSFSEVVFVLDSELVAKQMSGKFKIKNQNLKNLYSTAKFIREKLGSKIYFISVPRAKNKLADFLVNKTLDENNEKFHVTPGEKNSSST